MSGFVGYQYIDGASALIATAALSDGTVLAVLDGGRLVQLDVDTGVIVKTFDTLDASDSVRADFGTFLRVSGDGRTAAYSVPKFHARRVAGVRHRVREPADRDSHRAVRRPSAGQLEHRPDEVRRLR